MPPTIYDLQEDARMVTPLEEPSTQPLRVAAAVSMSISLGLKIQEFILTLFIHLFSHYVSRLGCNNGNLQAASTPGPLLDKHSTFKS